MHRCGGRIPCRDPLASRRSVALSAVRSVGGLTVERAREARELYGARSMRPDQIAGVAISLALRQAEGEDLPCSELEALVRHHLGSKDLPLIAACLQEEDCGSAWCELGRRLTRVVSRMRLARGIDRDEVLDEAFLRLRRRVLSRYGNLRPLDAFLAGVARNVARELKPRSGPELPPGIEGPGATPLDRIAEAEAAQFLERAIRDLPWRERHVLELRRTGATFAEIARLAALPSRKAAARLFRRALASLRLRLRHSKDQSEVRTP
jgi:hypothetical protein